jgi:hypothetical protein
VGPGNKFVAEAKRMLFGKVGIDVFAALFRCSMAIGRSPGCELTASARLQHPNGSRCPTPSAVHHPPSWTAAQDLP